MNEILLYYGLSILIFSYFTFLIYFFLSVSLSTKSSQKSTCVKIKNTSYRAGNSSKASRNGRPSCCSHAPIYSCSSQPLEATRNFRPGCWPFCFYRRAPSSNGFAPPWGPTAFTHFTRNPLETNSLSDCRLWPAFGKSPGLEVWTIAENQWDRSPRHRTKAHKYVNHYELQLKLHWDKSLESFLLLSILFGASG